MAQTDCSWHLAVWEMSWSKFLVICRRYADALTLFYEVSDENFHPFEKGLSTLADLTEFRAVHQSAVGAITRAKLRAKLAEIECKTCRCPSCKSNRYHQWCVDKLKNGD